MLYNQDEKYYLNDTKVNQINMLKYNVFVIL